MLDLLHYLSVENVVTQLQSPRRPFRIHLFRNLLIADLVSDIGTFMQSVGTAWLITSLTTSPMYVALIQTASALPFFLLALPAGSIGDIVDRRKLILRTELWVLAIYLFVFQGSVAVGSTLWGVAAEHTSANTALLFSSIGIAACLALPDIFSIRDERNECRRSGTLNNG